MVKRWSWMGFPEGFRDLYISSFLATPSTGRCSIARYLHTFRSIDSTMQPADWNDYRSTKIEAHKIGQGICWWPFGALVLKIPDLWHEQSTARVTIRSNQYGRS